MRFFGLVSALLAAVALAQTQVNYIEVPQGGFDVVAGQPFTLTWANPSSGNVNIRLTQGNNIDTATAGIDLGTVSASAGTATFTIPEANSVNNGQWNFALVDPVDSSNDNFSSSFQISGANVVQTSAPPNTSTSASLSSASSSASSASSASASSSSSASSASASTSASSSASSSSASAARSSSSSASQSSASASAAATTAVSSTNGASYAQAGGLLAIMAGVVAVF